MTPNTTRFSWVYVAGIVLISVGVSVMRVTLVMSLPYLLAAFIACSTPGVVFGYRLRGWQGALACGGLSAFLGMLLLFSVCERLY